MNLRTIFIISKARFYRYKFSCKGSISCSFQIVLYNVFYCIFQMVYNLNFYFFCDLRVVEEILIFLGDYFLVLLYFVYRECGLYILVLGHFMFFNGLNFGYCCYIHLKLRKTISVQSNLAGYVISFSYIFLILLFSLSAQNRSEFTDLPLFIFVSLILLQFLVCVLDVYRVRQKQVYSCEYAKHRVYCCVIYCIISISTTVNILLLYTVHSQRILIEDCTFIKVSLFLFASD